MLIFLFEFACSSSPEGKKCLLYSPNPAPVRMPEYHRLAVGICGEWWLNSTHAVNCFPRIVHHLVQLLSSSSWVTFSGLFLLLQSSNCWTSGLYLSYCARSLKMSSKFEFTPHTILWSRYEAWPQRRERLRETKSLPELTRGRSEMSLRNQSVEFFTLSFFKPFF